MLPSLDSLRHFVAAARLKSFTKAARSVALTPAAFGQRIKQLEELLGARLFVRTTRSVLLTDAAMALLPHAEECIAVAERAVRSARGESGPAPTDVVLGTRHELGLSWILPQLDAIAKSQPWMHIHLYFGASPDLLHRVRSLEIDCAVTSARWVDPKLTSIRLHREDYLLVGARRLLERAPLTRDEHAQKHTLLDISPDLPLLRYWMDSPRGGDRLHFGRYTYLGTLAAIHHRVLDEAGVAVLPEYLVRKDVATGRLLRVLPKVELVHDYFRLVFRTDDPRRTVFESLAALLLKVPLQ